MREYGKSLHWFKVKNLSVLAVFFKLNIVPFHVLPM